MNLYKLVDALNDYEKSQLREILGNDVIKTLTFKEFFEDMSDSMSTRLKTILHKHITFYHHGKDNVLNMLDTDILKIRNSGRVSLKEFKRLRSQYLNDNASTTI